MMMEMVLLFLFLQYVVSLAAIIVTNYQSLLRTYIQINIETIPIIDKGITVDECPLSEGKIGANFSNFAGGQILINCTLIDGFPFPNISWFHADTALIMLRNSSKIVITVDDDTIGEYTCVATNMLGSDSATSFADNKG